MNILFPGRHLVNTRFQEEYLYEFLGKNSCYLDDLVFASKENKDVQNNKDINAKNDTTISKDNLNNKNITINKDNIINDDPIINRVIFAITSANRQNSRLNPIDYEKRILGIDRFSQSLRKRYPFMNYRIIGIPDFGITKNFPGIVIKEIYEQTGIELNKNNTLVLCSTRDLMKLYMQEGYGILPAEWDRVKRTHKALRPIDLVGLIAQRGDSWYKDERIISGLSESTISLLNDFPEIVSKICRIYNEQLLDDQGNITKERDYDIYSIGMANNEIIKIKYNDIKKAIRPGKIVDEGCADGALLIEVAKDYGDSDLIGIDLSAEFIARAEENKRAGRFGRGTYVHFHQRNIMERIFRDDSIDTIISNSTGHEIWSYGDKEKSIDSYLKNKHDQLRKHGRLIMRDVIGPDDPDKEVYMLCSKSDGSNDNPYKEFEDLKGLSNHLKGLSTFALFLRFSNDYLKNKKENPESQCKSIEYSLDTIRGKEYIVLKHKDAVEFMTKKDYHDNWLSEMNEEFAFWNFSQWKNHVKAAGFRIIEDNDASEQGSRQYTNQWIVNNRWKHSVSLYEKTADDLKQMPYPQTNMVLVAEKA